MGNGWDREPGERADQFYPCHLQTHYEEVKGQRSYRNWKKCWDALEFVQGEPACSEQFVKYMRPKFIRAMDSLESF